MKNEKVTCGKKKKAKIVIQSLPGWERDLGTWDVSTETAGTVLPLLPTAMLWRFLTVAIAPRNVSRKVRCLAC